VTSSRKLSQENQTHVHDDSVVDGIQMHNSGSDYGDPKVIFFEVKSGMDVYNGTKQG
jgi:hypothetical protein